MSRRYVAAAMIALSLMVPTYVRAHEGHKHKVMGTVVTLREHDLQVETTDGKSSTVTLNEKTRVLRGTAKAEAEDIKPGERVVVTAMQIKGKDGQTTMIATEVRLPGAAASK